MSAGKYTNQLRIVLQQYQKTYSDIGELYWAKTRIQEKSKNNVYKEINLREIDRKIAELTNE